MSIEAARSFVQGQVSRDEVLVLVQRFREGGPADPDGPYKVQTVTELLDEIDSYDVDILVADGDLHIPGDLDLGDMGCCLLVDGDLTVDGCYRDSDEDPQNLVLVTGNLRARDIITAGFLEVHGTLTCGRLIGDYNDCSAHISGDVVADLFYGEEHFFTIGGELRVTTILGSADRGRPRLAIATEPTAVVTVYAPEVLDHVDRDLVEAHDDTEDGRPVVRVEGLRFGELKERVTQGLPLLTR